MKKIIFFLTAFASLTTLAQKLNTYSGEYDLKNEYSNFHDYGKANYTYYETEESERIKDGKFVFNGDHLKIVGYFKNGLRDSLWIITYKDLNDYKKTIKQTTVATANYKDGKLNGKCSLIRTEYPSKAIIESSSATFIDNKLVGAYSYFKNSKWDKNDNVILKFNFDSLGQLNGEYKAEYNRDCCIAEGHIEEERTYNHGLLLYRLCREKVNGKIYYRFKDGKYTIEISGHDVMTEDGKTFESKSILSNSAEVGANIWFLLKYPDLCGVRHNPLYVFFDGVTAEFEIHDQLLDLE